MTGLDDLRFIEPPGGPSDLVVWCRGPVERSSSAVLLVHDRASNARCWDLVMRRLPAGLAVISVDLRGRASAWRSEPSIGIASHVADLISLLDRLDIDEVLAVGHGFGAGVSSEFARLAPDRVPLAIGVLGRVWDDPFAAVLGLAFPTRQEHEDFWLRHVRFRRADRAALAAFVGHGVAGPSDHHRWRVDLRSLVADDQSLAAIEHPVFTRTIVAGPVEAGAGSRVHLPDHDPVAVLLDPSGADAVAAQIGLLIG